MAQRRPHDRVDQLREEAGVSLSPSSVEVRHRTMMDMQMESLGTSRRDSISSQDFPKNRGPPVSRSTIEASRLSNRPGTQEFQSSREDQAELSAWNNAYKELEDDGTIEEDLQDINHGQTHRMKLAVEQSARRRGAQGVRGDLPRGNQNPRGTDRARGTDRIHDTHHAHGVDRARGSNRVQESDRVLEFVSPRETIRPRGLDRSRGGARGGRGGGHAGGQTRGSRTSRVPVRYPDDSPPVSSVQQEFRELEFCPTSDEGTLKPTTPAAAAPDVKLPVTPKWDQKLASPAAFMAAVNVGSLPITSKEVDQSIGKEVEQIGGGNSSRQLIDTLMSTLIDFEPSNKHDPVQLPLKAEEKPLSSYRSDLIGLNLGVGASSFATERNDGGKKSENSETEDIFLPSGPEKPISDVLNHLLQVVPAMGQSLRLDSIAKLEDIVAQLKLKDSSLAIPQDTKKLVPVELPSTGQAVQVLPFSDVEKRKFTAASSNEIKSMDQLAIAGHSESKGAEKGETFSRQSNFSWTTGQKDVHSSPLRTGSEEMIIGTHLMPGQSHRQGVSRSSGGTTPVQKLPTVNHPGSTTSSLGALLPASLKPSLPGTSYKNEDPRATRQFATRRDSNWSQSDSYRPSTRTGLKDSVISTALEKIPSMSPFVQHDAPVEGSMLNRTGFVKPENQSSMSTSQPAPASPVLSMTFGNTQVQRVQETPGTYMADSQHSKSVETAALSVMAEPAADRASVFKTTFTPTGPSQLNRTGFFREEHPGTKHSKSEK